MKAKTIEELRKEFCEIYKLEYIPLMSNILFQYVQHLEQKLIQPEPQRVVEEEDIWNKKDLEKVKNYILTESAKQTEQENNHIIDFANRLSEPKQVTEGEIRGIAEKYIHIQIMNYDFPKTFNNIGIKTYEEGIRKGLSLQNKDIVSGAVCDHVFYPSVEMDGTRFEYCRSCGERK